VDCIEGRDSSGRRASHEAQAGAQPIPLAECSAAALSSIQATTRLDGNVKIGHNPPPHFCRVMPIGPQAQRPRHPHHQPDLAAMSSISCSRQADNADQLAMVRTGILLYWPGTGCCMRSSWGSALVVHLPLAPGILQASPSCSRAGSWEMPWAIVSDRSTPAFFPSDVAPGRLFLKEGLILNSAFPDAGSIAMRFCWFELSLCGASCCFRGFAIGNCCILSSKKRSA